MELSEKAGTQYNDYLGTVALDEQHSGGLNALARDCGVPDGYQAVACEFSIGEYGQGADRRVWATVYAFKGEFTGEEDSTGPLDVYKFEEIIDVSRIPELFKRIDVHARLQRFESTPMNVLED